MAPQVGTAEARPFEEAASEAVAAVNRGVADRCRVVWQLLEHHVEAMIEAWGSGGRPGGELDGTAYDKLTPFDHTVMSLIASTGATSHRAKQIALLAQDVHEWAPAVLGALDSGAMDERIAIELCNRMRDYEFREFLQDQVVTDFLARLARGERPSRQATLDSVEKTARRIDPDAVAARRRTAVRRRSVRFRPAQDGMCDMSASLPAADAAILSARIDAAAGSAGPDDDRELPARRADALLALATGAHQKYTDNPDAKAPTNGTRADATDTTTDTDTDTGGDGTTGEFGAATATCPDCLRRHGSIHPVDVTPILRPQITIINTGSGPPRIQCTRTGETSLDLLTKILADGQGATFETIDALPGTADPFDRARRYRPSPAMIRRIRLRDGTCRHPGCTVPAEHCDVDHVIPFDPEHPEAGGLTIEANLMCLCRAHHRYKTFSGARYEINHIGRLTIELGTHTLTTRPTGPLADARDHFIRTPDGTPRTPHKPPGTPTPPAPPPPEPFPDDPPF